MLICLVLELSPNLLFLTFPLFLQLCNAFPIMLPPNSSSPMIGEAAIRYIAYLIESPDEKEYPVRVLL